MPDEPEPTSYVPDEPEPTPYVPDEPEPTSYVPDEPTTFTLIPPQEEERTVLGASRVRDGGAVLGAKRGTDQAVLGKRRRPATGDSLAIFVWMIALFAAVGGVITSLLAMRSNNKKNK